MLSSFASFAQSFAHSFGFAPAPAGIVAVLAVLVIVGLVAGIYQEAKLRKTSQRRRLPRATSYSSDEIEIQVGTDPGART
jgi:hypothetical protein